MEPVGRQQKIKLQRTNAQKRIDYNEIRSAPQSPARRSFTSEEEQLFARSLGSFRVHGNEGRDELERMCRDLGLPGLEALSIPAADWEVRKARTLSRRSPLGNEGLSREIEGLSRESEGQPRNVSSFSSPERSSPNGNEVSAVSTPLLSEAPSVSASDVPGESEGRGFERSGLEGGRELVVSVRTRGSCCSIKPLSDATVSSACVQSFTLAPPPSMSLKVSNDKAASTWDIVKSFAPEGDGVSQPFNERVWTPNSPESDDGSDSDDESEDEKQEEDGRGAEVERGRSWVLSSSSSGGDSFTSSIENAVYAVSKEAKFKIPFKSWIKGQMLGRGSFGTVYEGISDAGVFFAVKEVSLVDQGLGAKQCISQLQQEIALLSQFEHENIVQYLGTDQESEKLYIFLELVTQGSLSSLYQKYRLIDSQVRAYTRQILTGLKYLHDRNVMHRDIKCANILVDARGFIKLADFGLAKETSKLNELKSCKGSAYWMAPEVINPRKSYWLPADIWSLGCTVLEMLTRRPPNGDLEWHRAFWKVGHGEVPHIPDTLSRDAKDLIQRCLKFEAADRPSAAELLDHPFVKQSFSSDLSTAEPPTQSRHQRHITS